MQIYCTTCCKEKSTQAEKIPAIRRYLDERITTIFHKSQQEKKGFRIFSGKYGILSASDKIHWYDQILLPQEVNNMIDLVSIQLKNSNITSVIFFAKDPNQYPDWQNYITTIIGACDKLDIALEIKFLSS